MKAIVYYGPFSAMLDVTGDKRLLYFPKPHDMIGMQKLELQDSVVMEHTSHKLEFSYRNTIEQNGYQIQIYRFDREC